MWVWSTTLSIFTYANGAVPLNHCVTIYIVPHYATVILQLTLYILYIERQLENYGCVMRYDQRPHAEGPVSSERRRAPHHWNKTLRPYHARPASIVLASCLSTSDVQTCTSHHPVAHRCTWHLLADDVHLLSESDRRQQNSLPSHLRHSSIATTTSNAN